MAFPQLNIMVSSEQICCINTEHFFFSPPVTSVNKFTTWENEGLITVSRHGWIQVLQHSSTKHPSSDKWAIFDWYLQTSVTLCVRPGRRATHWQGRQQHHLKGLSFYWQSAFLEHIDSLNREHQPNNLLKAIVCFLGLAKHLVHVIQPCKTKLQSYFFEKKLPQLGQIMINLWFPMATTLWNGRWTLNHVLPSERYFFHL